MHSDIEHRSDAIIDQLTGLLNRRALSGRVIELAQQSRLTHEPIGVVVGDIDHFKFINDAQGHAVGDTVLKGVADRLRSELRAFDLAYRVGGEEFVIVLPGSDQQHSAELAERLREVVALDSADGVHVTMSFGVGASKRDEIFDYTAVYEKADRALYAAKQGGRDRVCVAQAEAVAQTGTRAYQDATSIESDPVGVRVSPASRSR